MDQPRMRVMAGPDSTSLKPIAVNKDESEPFHIKSSNFEGFVTVRVRNFEDQPNAESGYFEKGEGVGMNYSIQVSGRYLNSPSANDVLFGNVFENPIRDQLPYGTAAILKFIHLVDPGLQHDLYGEKPWALRSPLIVTMNSINVRTLPPGNDIEWSAASPNEDISILGDAVPVGDSNARKKYFAIEENRRRINFSGDNLITTDFCNGYVDFNNLSLKIGGFEISLGKYWDGQPVTYVAKDSESGKEYWVIRFQLFSASAASAEGTEVKG